MVDPTTAGVLIGGAVSVVGALAVPAQKAVAKLIGAYGNLGVAKIKASEQAVKDKADADTLMSKALAKAAADRAVQDPELISRTLERMAYQELSKQENREAIAKIALEHLSKIKTEQISPQPEDIDDDWLNVFGAHAERASSDRLRQMWAKVLAGEIRQRGSFSFSTLQVLAVIDADIAIRFRRVASCISDFGRLVADDRWNSGLYFDDLEELDTAGLVKSATTTSTTITFGAPAEQELFRFQSYGILLVSAVPRDFSVPVRLLTKAGREIWNIVDKTDDFAHVQSTASFLKKLGSESIRVSVGRLNADGSGLVEPIEISGTSS